MAPSPTISLVTPTWSGDLDHYRILLRSLAQGPLGGLEHTTVVQSEDFAVFSALLTDSQNSHTTRLRSTEQVLPPAIEQARRRATSLQTLIGRHITRISGSLSRELGWPHWPHYTGWHTQQISKLAMASQADTDYVLVVDSDVVVTPAADLTEILKRDAVVCFSDRKPLAQFKGKTRKWVLQADALLHIPPNRQQSYDSYFDTPFLLHVATLRSMFAWLEQAYQQPWWQVLLAQPPRRWSEFATYKAFLLELADGQSDTTAHWQTPDMMSYIFDASDTERLLSEFQASWQDPDIQFITVHSQSSGRQRWHPHSFADDLLTLIG